VVVLHAGLLRQELRPSVLHVIEHERHELHQGLLGFVLRGIWLAERSRWSCCSAAEKSEEIDLEYETENQQNDGATDADVDAAELKSATAASGLIAAILDVPAFAARSPSHEFLLEVRRS